MNFIRMFHAGALAFSLVALSDYTVAEATQGGKKNEKGQPAVGAVQGKPDEAAMAAAAKYTEPNENHSKLKALVGNWDVVSRIWMDPAAKPVESKGTSEKRMILGDRYVQEHYSGTVMGKPFVGQGLIGYDNAKQKFVNISLDNMSTAPAVYEGSIDAAGKDLAVSGTSFCPMEQKNKTFRMVTHIESDKKHILESFEVDPSGKAVKHMELIYTRKP